MKSIASLIMAAAWICGVVLANGFWSTLFAVTIPFWSFYLVAEKIMQAVGLI